MENKSKGFGFVCFENPKNAEEAYEKMKEKKIFDNLPPLYVNFAMKRSERQEILLKKKEEIYRLSQKMTIYARIKNEELVVRKFFRKFFEKLKSFKLTIFPYAKIIF